MSRRLPAFLLLLAIAARGVALARTSVVSTDGVNFSFMAQEILRGEWRGALAQDQHPLYPAAVAGARLLRDDPSFGLAAIALLSTAALFWLLWRLTPLCAGAEAVPWTLLLFAVHPLLTRNAADFLSETPCLVLVAGGLLAFRRWLEAPSARGEALLGALAGLAYLVRQDGAEILLGALVLLPIRLARREIRIGAALRWGIVAAAAFFIVVLPYLAHLRIEEGRWMISRKKSFLALFPWLDPAYGVHPPADALGVILPPLAVQVWIHTLAFWRELLQKCEAFHPLLALAAVAGGWTALRERRLPLFLGVFFWIHMGVLVVLLNGAGYLEKRHFVLAAFVSLPWAGLALSRLSALLARRLGPAAAAGILGAAVAAILLAKSVKGRREEDRETYRAAAEWIRLRLPEGGEGALAAPREREGQRLAFYAGRDLLLYDPGGGRLPLTPRLLSRSGGVLASPQSAGVYRDLLAGWEAVPLPQIAPDGEARWKGWILFIRKGEAR